MSLSEAGPEAAAPPVHLTPREIDVLTQVATVAETYVAAGKRVEAQQALQRVTTEFATSPYAADAKKLLETIKGGDQQPGNYEVLPHYLATRRGFP